ncbi:SET domain-containing protein [Neoconidiobolus thromboides FSU 785]|nr:SET domain-containing protein [Neoconidiobolus thromboides FSU 785]
MLDKFSKYLEWLKENQVEYKKYGVVIKKFEDSGYGLIANKDFKIGELYLNIPGNIIISFENIIKNHNLYDDLKKDKVKSLDSQAWLVFYLIIQHSLNESSFYYDYLMSLPQEFPILETIYNTQFLTSELFKTFSIEYQIFVKNRISKINEDFDKIIQIIKHYPDLIKKINNTIIIKSINNNSIKINEFLLNKNSFLWFYLIVNTRCIYFNDFDKNLQLANYSPLAVIPFMDLLNHKTDAKFRTEFKRNSVLKQGHCKFYTMESIKKGEQIFIQYGGHNDLMLLLEYGFILDKNMFNYIQLDSFVFLELLKVEKDKLFTFISTSNEPIDSNILNLIMRIKLVDSNDQIINNKLETIKEFNLDNDLQLNNDFTLDYKTVNLLRLWYTKDEIDLWKNVFYDEKDKINNENELDYLNQGLTILKNSLKFYTDCVVSLLFL